MFDRLEATDQRYDDLTEELARPEISGDYEKLQAIANFFQHIFRDGVLLLCQAFFYPFKPHSQLIKI